MSRLASFLGGNAVIAGGAVAVIAVGLGLYAGGVFTPDRPEPQAPESRPSDQSVAPEAETSVEDMPEAVQTPQTPPATDVPDAPGAVETPSAAVYPDAPDAPAPPPDVDAPESSDAAPADESEVASSDRSAESAEQVTPAEQDTQQQVNERQPEQDVSEAAPDEAASDAAAEAVVSDEASDDAEVSDEAAPGEMPAADDATTTEDTAEAPAAPTGQGDATTADLAAQPRPEEAGPDTDTEESAARMAPAFDLVRVETDGSVVIAGRGAAGARIAILLDGDDLSEVQAGADGRFVSFAHIEPGAAPRVLSLVDRSGTGEIHSEASVIIAPQKRDVASASTEPEADSAPSVPADQPVSAPERDIAATTERPADAPDAGTLGESVTAAAEDIPEAPTAEDTAAATVADQPAASADAADDEAIAGSDVGADTPAPAVPETPRDVAEPPVVVLADDEGVRVLQGPDSGGATPEVMDAVALDAISYSDEGAVQLAGRGRGDSFVRVYLDNTPITRSRIAADGNWRTELPQVDTGVYTLRVDEVDDEGKVLSRIETPFKREAPEKLEAKGGPAPPISAVTVQPGDTLWAISRDRYGRGILYVRVFEANQDRIRDPDLIYPGQVFDLPD
ncbi:LysM domain-containing protein [Salinihabitans flavidus]|uniref:LysM domain-containing protein n=1 Tax=Salinihabitans flavidus TaxID=569882 RepID=A0A1H8NLM4_9RHOB|nr:LysM peptidoglycan-binding domain-containing protein [Salinihabitans flavidus]SEO30283.1 LysM domain-containing protein [Salinihabitans flavidus]